MNRTDEEAPLAPEHEPIDRLLRDFFHAQVPASWPAFVGKRSAMPTRQIRWTARVAVAASLAVGVMSYVALARHVSPPRPAIIDRQQTIGFLPSRKPLVTPPAKTMEQPPIILIPGVGRGR